MATPNPSVLAAQVRTTLATVPGCAVFDGQVPTKVPVDAAGYVLPYVVLWTGIGSDLPAERDLSGLVDTGVLDWPFQTTVVGASASICRDVAHAVRQALTNLRIGDGRVMPDPNGFTVTVPQPDNQVTPARFFLPLQWRLTTTQ